MSSPITACRHGGSWWGEHDRQHDEADSEIRARLRGPHNSLTAAAMAWRRSAGSTVALTSRS
ncbi:hypothetical protein AB0C34_14610 [Nocardia sp. NPDC049220]|uniref:hypothetical protein n=1 Tax=Nocardia sp. NPDC049220 TaxID=3155273 RepID=UPI0033D8DC78